MRPAVILILVGLAVHAFLAWRPGGVVATGRLPDTDAYARTMRVERLLAGEAWRATDLPQMNAPEGLTLHWTRPLDVLIAGPTRVVAALGVPVRTALFWVGAAVSPVLHLACALAAVWAAAALWPGWVAWAAGAAVLANPLLLFAYGAFGQTDHHMLVLLMAILALGAAVRAVDGARGAAWGAGVALGAGVWVSPETLLVAAPLLAGFGLAWWLRDGAAAGQAVRLALGMLGVVALAVASEQPPGRWLAGEYDKVSAQHALIAALAAAGLAVLGRVRGGRGVRLLAGGLVAGAAGAVLLMAYPGALRASEAAADGSVAALFLPHVAEMMPPDGLRGAVLYAGGALAGIAVWPWAWRGARWPGVAMLLLVLAATLLATLVHRRFGVDLAAASAVCAAGLAARGAGRRAGLLAAVAVLLPYAGLALPDRAPARAEAGACDWTALADHLAAQAPAGAPIVMTDTWRSPPELAWRTGYRFVVAPYHRGGSAFRDTDAVMGAGDDAAAQAVLARRGVSFLLLCRLERPAWRPAAAGTLEARLRAGETPGWLAEEALPAGLSAFRLLRVVR